MAEKVGKLGPMVWDHEIDASLIDSVFQQTGCKVSWRKRPQYGAGKKLTITGPEKKLQDAMGLVIELARKRSASDVTVERPADHSARLDWSQQNLKEFGARPGKRRGEEQQQQRSSSSSAWGESREAWAQHHWEQQQRQQQQAWAQHHWEQQYQQQQHAWAQHHWEQQYQQQQQAWAQHLWEQAAWTDEARRASKEEEARRSEAATRAAQEEENPRREDERRKAAKRKAEEEEEEKLRRNAVSRQEEEEARKKTAEAKKKAEDKKRAEELAAKERQEEEEARKKIAEAQKKAEEKKRAEELAANYDKAYPKLARPATASRSPAAATNSSSLTSATPSASPSPSPPPQPRRKTKVVIVTLGVENVAGRRPISSEGIMKYVQAPESLGGRWPRKTLLLDCHGIWRSSERPPHIGSHIGTNPIIVAHILGNEHSLRHLQKMLDDVASFLCACQKDDGEFAAIICFCKWGKHRSVGSSWCVDKACQKSAIANVIEVRHLNRFLWGRHSCGRVHCEGCDNDSNLKRSYAEAVERMFGLSMRRLRG